MLDKAVETLLSKLNSDNHYTDIQLEQIKYSILAIWGDFSKFLILLALFRLLGHPLEYLYAFITTTLLRVYTGGKHLKTYYGCLLFSSLYYYILIFLTNLLTSRYELYLLLLSIFSAIILLLIVPQISKKSGRNYITSKYKVKLITLFLIIVYISIYLIKKEPMYAMGPFSIIFQMIQLLIMKGENYYEIRKETKSSS